MRILEEKEISQKGRKEKFLPHRGIPQEYLEVAAYYHWQSRGCPWGDPLTDWLAATKEWNDKMERSRRKWWLYGTGPVPFFSRFFR